MKAIFCCAILALMLVVGLCSEGLRGGIEKHAEDCFKAHDVTGSDFEELSKKEHQEVPDNFKCALHCMMSRAGVMDESGQLLAEVIKKELTEEEKEHFEKALEKCALENAENHCDTAYATFKCMLEQKN